MKSKATKLLQKGKRNYCSECNEGVNEELKVVHLMGDRLDLCTRCFKDLLGDGV